MERTTNKKKARARLLEAQAAAAAEREARERQNIEDLAVFMVETAKADDVDEWVAGQVDKARRDGEARRLRHRAAAGKALQAMRFRGETITAIAGQAGITAARVREYLKLVTVETAVETAVEPGGEAVAEPAAAVEVVPSAEAGRSGGHDEVPVVVGAQ